MLSSVIHYFIAESLPRGDLYIPNRVSSSGTLHVSSRDNLGLSYARGTDIAHIYVRC